MNNPDPERNTTMLLAWHNDPKLKRSTVAIMAAHRKADTLIKGVYWEGGKGCAVGCLIHGSDHAQYEPRFGIPQALARLEDAIFENLPNADALEWPERFLVAAKPGADLSLVQWQFLAFVVDEALSRKEAASVREECQPALEVVRAKARGEPVAESAARSAESAAIAAWSAESAARNAAESAESAASAARSAAWSAEWSAVWSAESAASAARSAAWSAESAAIAAWSAESAARNAAWSAESAASAARSAAERAAWKRYADKLIELMEAAPDHGGGGMTDNPDPTTGTTPPPNRQDTGIRGWRPIETVPDNELVLVWDYGSMQIAIKVDGAWHGQWRDHAPVWPTLWLPLPPPPEGAAV